MAENKDLDTVAIRLAVKKLAKHQLHRRLKSMDGAEASRILPEIWPIIQELCSTADAAEANMIVVRVPKPRPVRAKAPPLTFTSIRGKGKPLSEEQIRNLFDVMHHPDAPTRKLAEARRKFG